MLYYICYIIYFILCMLCYICYIIYFILYMLYYICYIIYVIEYCICNELRGNMARSTQFPIMITRSTIIYEIASPGAAGSSIYI